MIRRTDILLSSLAALLVGPLSVGCAGDPELEARGAAALEDAEEVPREVWLEAPAGCEGYDPSVYNLASVEDEPLLAALVGSEGDVVCVDALALLLMEIDPGLVDPVEDDPSPQPSDPTDPREIVTISMASSPPPSPDADSQDHESGGPVSDPTPTPMFGTNGDPTPTPMYPGGTGEDPTPTPMLGTDPGEDPTPTPMYGGG